MRGKQAFAGDRESGDDHDGDGAGGGGGGVKVMDGL
jgi:hypothetical protein